MEDRSALFNQLKEFSQRKLKKVETKVVTGLGEQLVEKRGAKGLQVLSGGGATGANAEANQEPARKLDLQVGFILPGLLMGSQDVAHDKSSLESYGIEYILNLDAEVANKFEDDYNYKNVPIRDKEDFELEKVLDECFDFIDDGRHRSNVYVHCSGTVGLSRSTAICIAYLMNKEKQSLEEAFNNVKEARSFVRPNAGFLKQLKDYEVKLRGAQAVKESGIDDPFALRKKQEIEQEKAMVAGAASVKNRMKMFGATLDTNSAPRSKSVSPMPAKDSPASTTTNTTSTTGAAAKTSATSSQPASKWGAKPASTPATSKSMTPEPRKSWQSTPTSSSGVAMGPPPPPPMPAASLHANDKSLGQASNTTKTSSSSSSSKSSLSGAPPPPPPQPPAGSLLRGEHMPKASHTTSPAKPPAPASAGPQSHKPASVQKSQADARKASISESSDDEQRQKMVFGRRPPPPMKIRAGLSIERNDSVSADKQAAGGNAKSHTKGSLQLPLKKQFTSDSDGESGAKAENPRAPSPSAALRAAKQQVAAGKQHAEPTSMADRKQSSAGLNRSSTKKLLNLIKTKTRTDLTLPDGDENDEIEALLGALESESIENIDWDELGLDEDEVKDIIKRGEELSSSESSDDSSQDGDEEVEEEEEEEVETSTMHYVIRTK